MSYPPFNPDDPGCGPALLDLETGNPLPDSHPDVILGRELWKQAPMEQRRAFYQVTAFNSRKPEDIRLAGIFIQNFQVALKAQKVQA